MRLTTWNVNGIRNPFSYPPWNAARTFPTMFDVLESDIVVMQELKIQRKDLKDDMVMLDGWDCYFSLPKHKKGYSGVGIYTRNASCAPIKAEEGLLGVLPSPSGVPYCELPDSIGGYPDALQVAELGVDAAALDAEGRCVVLEFPAFVLFGVYSPANSNGLRDDFRYGFICALDCRIRNLVRQGKRVVLVGDLNVSRSEMDTASALEDMRKSGITHEEYISTPNRRIFNQLLIGGEVVGEPDEGREEGVLWDTTRAFHPTRRGMYTHWEQKINARPGNYGSRIDFILVSGVMQSWIRNADIQEGLLGSDHCPVFVDFHDEISADEGEMSMIDLMNPHGTFVSGTRKLDWKQQATPLFSAKRLPEFDKRRSIKSMFAAPVLKHSQTSQSTTTELDKEKEQAPIAQSPIANPPPPNPPTTNSPVKRKASETANKDRTLKKQKSDIQAAPSRNQQSLRGFFQTKESASKDSKTESPVHPSEPQLPTPAPAPPSPTASDTPSPRQIASQVDSAEQNQRSWGALFSRPVAPLCEHGEPCKTMLTKKKGSNQGRSFWMCARPLGPSGDKERGTQWRCPTFIWCSDWTGKRDTAKGEKALNET